MLELALWAEQHGHWVFSRCGCVFVEVRGGGMLWTYYCHRQCAEHGKPRVGR